MEGLSKQVKYRESAGERERERNREIKEREKKKMETDGGSYGERDERREV